MPVFSRRSLAALASCHPDLQTLAKEVVRHRDCACIEGHRTPAQQPLFAQGRTAPGRIVTNVDGVRVVGPHNHLPSRAIHLVPWRAGQRSVEWGDKEAFYQLGGFVLGVASQLRIGVRWGGDWDRDGDYRDQQLIDLPHYELLG